MCTVSYLPLKKGYRIVSSRDEHSTRKTAIAPAVYRNGAYELLYPKDAQAGGSWIGIHSKGHAAVLLNGAFTPHVAEPPYRCSRGLIFLSVLSSIRPVRTFRSIVLSGVEPFTLLIHTGDHFFECRWDGKQKHLTLLNKENPQIWSSVTLYSPEVIVKRKQWFQTWFGKQQSSLQSHFSFHFAAGKEDPENAVLMNRDKKLFTVSVTGMEVYEERAEMHYIDLVNGSETMQAIHFTQTEPVL